MTPRTFHDLKTSGEFCIEDEYGNKCTSKFPDILLECPIMFFDNIGIEFF
jgi:hypothetical protein